MTSSTKLPAHGTVQRYRHELKQKRDGKGKGPCDRCRSANSERAKAARTNAEASRRRSEMSIVPDVTSAGHTDAHSPATDTKPAGRRKVGVMEQAVTDDIAEIDEALQVPFHRSLSALALEMASEIDEPATTASARRDARKLLFDVLRSLRTQKEGGDGSALTLLLEQAGFGDPLVPGRPT